MSPADLKNAVNHLPPSPQVFGKLGKLLRDPSTGLNNITDWANTDASLTAQLLGVRNNDLYEHGIPIASLDDAINRVGIRAEFKLVGAAAVSEVFSNRNVTCRVDGTNIWENTQTQIAVNQSLITSSGLDPESVAFESPSETSSEISSFAA